MKLKKSLITTLSLSLAFSAISPLIANAETVQTSEIENQVVPSNDVSVFEDGITINGKYYSAEEFSKYLDTVQITDLNEQNNTPGGFTTLAFAPAAGIYFIPGIGEVALAATGAIIVAGITIKAGSVLYDTISKWFNDPRKVVASKYDIPESLLDSDGKVRLGLFKDKYGNTPLKKKSGTFKKGKWTVEKDNANHGGRKWKIKKSGVRKGSLDGNGKVLSK